jgi:hypothetical protein
MATSGSTSFELTRDQIITRAYAKIGLPGEGNTLSTTQISDGAECLNTVIALAVTDGMPLWKRLTATVTPSTTSQAYTLANSVKVAQVVLRDVSSGVQYDLQNKSLYDFNNLPALSVGVPVHYRYAPALEGGVVYIWPPTSDASTVTNKRIDIIYQKEFDGFTASGETPDFPAYWTAALIYRTAVMLAPENGVPLQDRQALQQEASLYWKTASDYGDEDGSFYMQPDRMRW